MTLERSNQSILKEISPGISLEGMMVKLKLQYFGHLMRRVDSLEKTLFWGAPKSLQVVIAAMKLKDAFSLEGKL